MPAEDSLVNRIIYIIHGDGDYVFHENGESYLSDEIVLQQAITNAEKGTHSEYFIFHYNSKRSFLIFFPGEESEFYHYRNGQLITEKKFFRFDPVDGHSAESFLIRESASIKNIDRNILLYYGHEIPAGEEYGYNASFPEVPFGLKSLKGRIIEILDAVEKPKFDLLVLSTCNNGSPPFIFGLADIADYIIAAPGELHLSQMNSSSLQILEKNNLQSMNAFALNFASSAFEILRIKTLTEVVISVYNAKDLLNEYDPDAVCYKEREMTDLVRVFFRPAKFGKYQGRKEHSGWYCDNQKVLSRSGE